MNPYSDYDQEHESVSNNNNNKINHFSDSPHYDALKDTIAEQLFQINGQIGTVRQFITSLKKFYNQNNVNTEYVERIDKKTINMIHKIRDLLNKMNQSITEMNNIDENELNKNRLISREKLNKDIKLSIQEFQNIQIDYTKIMKLINIKAQEQLNQNAAALGQEEEEQQPDTDTINNNTSINRTRNNQMIVEMDPINNEEFLYQQNLIRERDAEIQNIEQGINELHGIFRDLSTVIQQQGVLVDNIEANIYSAVDNTQKGSKELHKAMLSQKRQSKLCIYLLIFLSIFLFFMILVVLS